MNPEMLRKLKELEDFLNLSNIRQALALLHDELTPELCDDLIELIRPIHFVGSVIQSVRFSSKNGLRDVISAGSVLCRCYGLFLKYNLISADIAGFTVWSEPPLNTFVFRLYEVWPTHKSISIENFGQETAKRLFSLEFLTMRRDSIIGHFSKYPFLSFALDNYFRLKTTEWALFLLDPEDASILSPFQTSAQSVHPFFASPPSPVRPASPPFSPARIEPRPETTSGFFSSGLTFSVPSFLKPRPWSKNVQDSQKMGTPK